jgi:hypothetical protein
MRKYSFAILMFFWGVLIGGGIVLLVCVYG